MCISNADAYEQSVSDYINTFPGITSKKPNMGTSYSDILVKKDNIESWVEIKMNSGAQLGSPRFFYKDKKWQSANYSGMKGYCIDNLNNSLEAKKFISDLEDFIGIEDISIPNTKSKLQKEKNAVPLEAMNEYLLTRENKYVMKISNTELGHMVKSHYLEGKAEPAYYMSIGDNFYILGDSNPLNVPKDVPLLSGKGNFCISMSVRSKFYETIPRIKISKYEESPYSLHPGTKKKNPFYN